MRDRMTLVVPALLILADCGASAFRAAKGPSGSWRMGTQLLFEYFAANGTLIDSFRVASANPCVP